MDGMEHKQLVCKAGLNSLNKYWHGIHTAVTLLISHIHIAKCTLKNTTPTKSLNKIYRNHQI